jgi:hypothetical protein
MGIILLETLLQLHTSGWLHKALSSHKLLTFKSIRSDRELPPDPGQLQIYLTGHLYARPGDIAELTEPGQTQMDAELYRHPLSLGASRTRYRKSFDLIQRRMHFARAWGFAGALADFDGDCRIQLARRPCPLELNHSPQLRRLWRLATHLCLELKALIIK